jgi:hypothetical protein
MATVTFVAGSKSLQERRVIRVSVGWHREGDDGDWERRKQQFHGRTDRPFRNIAAND